MADNVLLPLTGSGDATASAATDEVGGAHYQRVKVDVGGDGVSSPLVRGQQAGANSLPVVLASDQGAVPVSAPTGATYTDCSLALTTGGTSQQLVAANASRKGVLILNPSSQIESLFVNFGAAATTDDSDSIELVPGAREFFPTVQAIQVNAATTGHKVIAKELA